jgi:hypothetical protein
MNDKLKKLRTRFAPETRFEVPAVPFRERETTELERLKDRLLLELLRQGGDLEQDILLRRAAQDAAAIAWATRFPLLVFPTLLEEKARAARRQHRRQQQIRRQSPSLIFAV